MFVMFAVAGSNLALCVCERGDQCVRLERAPFNMPPNVRPVPYGAAPSMSKQK